MTRTEPTADQLAHLRDLETAADHALKVHGVESAAYADALCAVGNYEATLMQLQRTPEAAYVNEHRPY